MSRRARTRPNKRAACDPRKQEREDQSAMDAAFEQLARERAQQQTKGQQQ